MSSYRTTHKAGLRGNIWNGGATTGADEDGFSKIVDVGNLAHICLMGVKSGSATFRIYLSQDGVSWFYSESLTDDLDPVQYPVVKDWESGENYVEGDIVKDNGDYFICIQDHKAVGDKDTDNSDYWVEVDADYPRMFGYNFTTGARYIRLNSSADITAVVTCAAKP